MVQRLLAIAVITTMLQLNCSDYKDVFVIDFKRKGINSLKIIPRSGRLELYKTNIFGPKQYSDEEMQNLDHLEYKGVDFSVPLPFPNGLIKEGYIFAYITLDIIEEGTGHKKYATGIIDNIKANYYYTLTLPTRTEVGEHKMPRYVCADGSIVGSGLSLCVLGKEIK